jgi:hypothetical protein
LAGVEYLIPDFGWRNRLFIYLFIFLQVSESTVKSFLRFFSQPSTTPAIVVAIQLSGDYTTSVSALGSSQATKMEVKESSILASEQSNSSSSVDDQNSSCHGPK